MNLLIIVIDGHGGICPHYGRKQAGYGGSPWVWPVITVCEGEQKLRLQ